MKKKLGGQIFIVTIRYDKVGLMTHKGSFNDLLLQNYKTMGSCTRVRSECW
jgi:hypothetical protein